jgi:membrane glycosyltransferase
VIGTAILVQTLVASYALLAVLPYQGSTVLEQAILAVFAVLFAWISAGFWIGLLGFLVRFTRGDPLRPSLRYAQALQTTALAPTAIVYPIYHEDVARTLAGVRSTFLDVERGGYSNAFEFFVLSDSRDPEVWLREREACQQLRDRSGRAGTYSLPASPHQSQPQDRQHRRFPAPLGTPFPLSGGDGRRQRHAGTDLGADGPADGGGAADRHPADQSGDHQCRFGARTPAAVFQPPLRPAVHRRARRFATRRSSVLGAQRHHPRRCLHAPLRTATLAWLGLHERFGAEPRLRRGHLHAACRLRGLAGSRLGGSYEEAPPTLVDELERDRRWAHGNLQHLYFMFRRGVAFAHRFAFANGIMAYVASALWFSYLALITLELARFTLWPIEYFTDPYSPFPVWPQWQPQWALRLVLSTLFLLFAPKLLALLEVAFDRARARAMGGFGRVALGVLLESLASILLAPIRMLSHTRYVVVTLFNLKVRWAGQNRTQEIGWREAVLHHLPGALLALAWSAFAYWLKPMFFYWSLPVAVPLVLAAPVSVWLSRFSVGRRWRNAGLLLTPEEQGPPAVVAELAAAPADAASGLSAFDAAVLHPQKNRLHVALAHRRRDTQAHRWPG